MLSYQNRYGITSLNTLGAGFIQPLSFGVVGFNAFRFGDELFSEQKLGLSFGSDMGLVSLGATLNYVQFRIQDLGSKRIFSFDFGGIISFSENFHFGAFITNINQARISSFENENLPTIMRAGISHFPIKGLMLNAEIEKDLDFPERFKAGVEYQFMKKFFVRTGFQTSPFFASFGLGFHTKKIETAYAFSSNINLGDMHELSVSYFLRKKS